MVPATCGALQEGLSLPAANSLNGLLGRAGSDTTELCCLAEYSLDTAGFLN